MNIVKLPFAVPKCFRQLRWKLMLSYTGVTIGVFLVVGVVATIAVYLWLDNQLRNTDLPYQLVEQAATQYLTELRPMLNRTPPDQGNINNLIERLETKPTLILLGDVPFTIEPGELQVIITDSHGVLLGATSDPILEVGIVGEVLDIQSYPELAETLQSPPASQGPSPGWRRAMLSNEVVIAAPVWDLNGEQVLGEMIISLTMPNSSVLVGEFLSTIILDTIVIILLTGIIGTFFGLLFGRGITRRLGRLADATLAWSTGDFSVYVDDSAEDELGQLTRRLNQMAQELESLLDARRRLVLVEERNRLARDLHDSVKQQAFAASAQINAAKQLVKTDPQKSAEHIEEAEQLADGMRKELTNLIEELRSPALEGKGLVAALQEYTNDWSRQNEIEVDLRAKSARSLPVDIEQTVFRIVQEALANIARHSAATKVEMRLVYSPNELTCTIRDDGIGFVPGQETQGFGIRSMKERAKAAGGKVVFEATPGEGTAVNLTLWLDDRRNQVEEDEKHGRANPNSAC